MTGSQVCFLFAFIFRINAGKVHELMGNWSVRMIVIMQNGIYLDRYN